MRDSPTLQGVAPCVPTNICPPGTSALSSSVDSNGLQLIDCSVPSPAPNDASVTGTYVALPQILACECQTDLNLCFSSCTYYNDTGLPWNPAPVQIGGLFAENAGMRPACPAGMVVASVDFASYGLPNGWFPNYYSSWWCASGSSQSVVERDCLGQNSCDLTAQNGQFGDPCYGTFKRLAVVLTCAVPEVTTVDFQTGSTTHFSATYGNASGNTCPSQLVPSCK